MTNDATFGGYLARHDRPPAFEGSDGRPYSAAVYVDDSPAPDGRFGAAILFVRWTVGGDAPDGHLETDYLSFGDTVAAAEAGVHRLSLHEVKAHLDRLIVERSRAPEW